MSEIAGVHVPECNDRCRGDWHELLADQPKTVEEVKAMVKP